MLMADPLDGEQVPSLLQKALQHLDRRSGAATTPERIDLALAWLTGTVTTGQAASALGTQSHNAPKLLATSLRHAFKQGRIRIK